MRILLAIGGFTGGADRFQRGRRRGGQCNRSLTLGYPVCLGPARSQRRRRRWRGGDRQGLYWLSRLHPGGFFALWGNSGCVHHVGFARWLRRWVGTRRAGQQQGGGDKDAEGQVSAHGVLHGVGDSDSTASQFFIGQQGTRSNSRRLLATSTASSAGHKRLSVNPSHQSASPVF